MQFTMVTLTNKQKAKIFHDSRRDILKSISDSQHQLLMHLIPEVALNNDPELFDISEITEEQLRGWLKPISVLGRGGFKSEFTYEGVRAISTNPDDPKRISYGELLRNGAVEHFSTELTFQPPQVTYRNIDGLSLAKEIFDSVIRTGAMWDFLKIDSPLYGVISLDTNNTKLTGNGGPIKVSRIELPVFEIIKSQLNTQDLTPILRKQFDILWQAAGAPRGPVKFM